MKILLCYYLLIVIVTAKVIIIFKIKHKRKKKSKINKCIYENRSYYASEVISKIPNRTPRPMPMGSCPRHKQKTERPKDQETNDVLLRNKWITYGILTNRRPRDPYDALRIEHPTPSRGGGRGRGKQHLEQAPLYPKEKLKKEVLCFSQILYRVFHSIVLQIRCFSIVSAREGRYDLFNHLKSDLK